jgi:hypothetical protein
MKSLTAVLVAACLAVATAVRASSFTTDLTDFWWDASESGWGISVTMQNDVAFATFFVYDAAGNPVWYSTDLHWQGNFVWSGNLYANRGPWFGGPFNPALVSTRPAGSVRFAVNDLNSASLTYTVDGVTVIKTVSRLTWKNENYSGSYVGGYSINASGCVPSSLNGIDEDAGVVNVVHAGNSLSLVISGTSSTCTFVGAYAQVGKLGQVNGTYSCTNGPQGAFVAYDMTPTISGFTARVQGQNQFCSNWAGYFGGLARVR